MNQEKIGKFIARSRKEKNLTQAKLGEKLNVSYKAVSKWENGRSMPDISIMQDLCNILGISLNELFAGEKIKEKDIKKESEKNLLELLKLNYNGKNKRKILITIVVILTIFFLIIIGKMLLVKYGFAYDDNLKYTQVYISGESNIKGDVDINEFGKISIDFDIGANKYGMAVFKNPSKAFVRLKKDYSEGIKLIKDEFNLLPLTNFTYKDYKTYGWQVTKGTKKAKEEARFVSAFLDIYENSFN